MSLKKSKAEPEGDLMIRTLAMPAQTNPSGDIFGGWIVSQMDLAGGSLSAKISKARVVTVSIESMHFLSPVRVGDFVCCYAKLLTIRTSSMRLHIEAWVQRAQDDQRLQVTEGIFTFVAINDKGCPIPVKREVG